MAVYIVTGNLGSGKSLVAMGRMRDYLEAGRRVATNVNVQVENLVSGNHKRNIVRTPDHPTADYLWDQLGIGSDSRDEKTFGMLMIDEVGTWLNSREWKDKDGQRQRVIEWFLHSRKRRWDVYLIVQSLNMIDKQVRESIAEHVVICRRLDRLPIPMFGWLINYVGLKVRMPQVHIAAVRYTAGMSVANSLTVDRWIYRGRDLWGSYDTSQRFSANNDGPASILCPKRYPWLRKPNGFCFKLLRKLEQLNWEKLHALVLFFHAPSDQEKQYRHMQLLGDFSDALLSQPLPSFEEWSARLNAVPLDNGFTNVEYLHAAD